MAKRDILKIYEAERHNIPKGYNILPSELQQLIEIEREGREVDALAIAFVYGFTLGKRAEKNRTKNGSSEV